MTLDLDPVMLLHVSPTTQKVEKTNPHQFAILILTSHAKKNVVIDAQVYGIVKQL